MAEKLKLEEALVGDAIGPYRYRVTREMVAFAASKEMLSSSRYSGDSSIAPSALTDNDYSLAFIVQYSPGDAIHTKAENHYFNPPIIGKELIVTGAISDKLQQERQGFSGFRNDHLRRGRAGDSQKQEYAALKPMTHASDRPLRNCGLHLLFYPDHTTSTPRSYFESLSTSGPAPLTQAMQRSHRE